MAVDVDFCKALDMGPIMSSSLNWKEINLMGDWLSGCETGQMGTSRGSWSPAQSPNGHE